MLATKPGVSSLFEEEVVCSSEHLIRGRNLNGLKVESEFLEDIV